MCNVVEAKIKKKKKKNCVIKTFAKIIKKTLLVASFELFFFRPLKNDFNSLLLFGLSLCLIHHTYFTDITHEAFTKILIKKKTFFVSHISRDNKIKRR